MIQKEVHNQIFAIGAETKACGFIEKITPERVISISESPGVITVWYWGEFTSTDEDE